MSIYADLSFRKKIVIPIGLFAVAIIGMAATSAYNVGQLKFVTHEVAAVSMPSISGLMEAKNSLNSAVISERSVLFTDVESEDFRNYIDQHQKALVTAELNLAQVTSMMSGNESYMKSLAQFQAVYGEWKKLTLEVIKERSSDTRAGRNLAIDISSHAAKDKFRDLSAVLNDLIALGRKDAGDMAIQAESLATGTQASMWAFGLVALGLCIGLVTIFPSLISRRLIRILDMIEDISKGEGDLTRRLDDNGKDEIGRISAAFNEFTNKIHDVLVTVKQASTDIVFASEEIASGNTNLSQRTEEQASSLEETASSMEEMTGTVKQNADSALEARKLAESNRSRALVGADVVTKAVEAMGDINASSGRIRDIISTIDGIAFQTNLLALNAAVEAARAGEQGRGFAVVASEVRALAQRSADAAKEIKTLIEDSVNKVKVGTNLVDESGKTLEEIIVGTQKVADIVSEIAAASLEQASGIDQVNNAITQMDNMTQNNAALVEEAAAASRSMEEQAQILMQQVNFFRLRDSGRRSVAFDENRPGRLPGGDQKVAPGSVAPEDGNKPETPGRGLRHTRNESTSRSEWEQF